MDALLERRSVEIDSPSTDEELDFLEKCVTRLGCQKQHQEADLLLALRELCIEPFTQASVDAYKLRKEQEMNRIPNRCFHWQFAGAVSVLFAGISLIVGFGAGIQTSLWWFLLPLLPLGFVYFAIRGYCRAMDEYRRVFGTDSLLRFAWEFFPLQEYPRPIPEFVLQTALDIKERCPDVCFLVDELCAIRVGRDPFLVVRSSRTETYLRYYIEVWNEPGFKQERIV